MSTAALSTYIQLIGLFGMLSLLSIGGGNVVLPEIAPSVGASCALVSALAMGTYGTALALVGTQVNILPLLLYAKIGDGGADFPATAALSIVLLALCSLILGLGDHFSRRREHAVFQSSH